MKTKLLTLVALAISINFFSQTPEGINYQAVMRNGLSLATNHNITIKFDINIANASGGVGAVVYSESHNVVTNNLGVVNLIIGMGVPSPTNTISFSNIDWGNNQYHLTTSVDFTGANNNFQEFGEQRLMSVPYALFSKTSENVINDQIDDADADPTNEIQDISLTGTDFSISGGSTVDLSTIQDGTGTDDQTLTLVGTNLTIESGNTIDLSVIGGGTDDQNLTGATLTGTTLQVDIENGTSTTVDLAGLQDGTGTDDQNISGSGLSGTDLTIGIEGGTSEVVNLSSLQDGTGTDDQTLSLAGTTLSIESGNNVDLSGYLDNTDAQTLSLAGSDLSISGGNTITLPNDNDWTVNGSEIHNANAGNVGIGTATPAGILDVTSTTSGVIMPRMTVIQRNAIATPVNGMMVYNTDEDCMNVYQASAWTSLCGGAGGGLGSNQDTLIYTTDGF